MGKFIDIIEGVSIPKTPPMNAESAQRRKEDAPKMEEGIYEEEEGIRTKFINITASLEGQRRIDFINLVDELPEELRPDFILLASSMDGEKLIGFIEEVGSLPVSERERYIKERFKELTNEL
jgi:hypothetical protein